MLFYPSDSQRLKEMSGESKECFCLEIHKIINSNRDVNKTMVGFQKCAVAMKKKLPLYMRIIGFSCIIGMLCF